MMLPALYLVLVCSVAFSVAGPTGGSDHSPPSSETEGDIIHELLHHRGDIKHGLPPSNGAVQVALAFLLQSVTKVREEEGIVEFFGYLGMRWSDPRLRFQYSQPFHTVKMVRMPPDHVWRPSIELRNQGAPGVQAHDMTRELNVNYNGTVVCVPDVSIPVLCDLADYLKGNHSASITCQLRFGSWSQDRSEVNLVLETIWNWDVLARYKPTGKWVATSASAERQEYVYPGSNRTMVDIVFTVTIKERFSE